MYANNSYSLPLEDVLRKVQIGQAGRERRLALVANPAPAHPHRVLIARIVLQQLDQIVLVAVVANVGLVQHAVPDVVALTEDVVCLDQRALGVHWCA